jgi:hypothetical protein
MNKRMARLLFFFDKNFIKILFITNNNFSEPCANWWISWDRETSLVLMAMHVAVSILSLWHVTLTLVTTERVTY